MSSDKLLSAREVGTTFGICTRTVWRRVQQGIIPKPVKHGRCTRFVESEIAQVIARLKQSRS